MSFVSIRSILVALIVITALNPVEAWAAFGINTAKTLKEGEVAVSYTKTLVASGGTKPYAWSITGGALPNGLARVGPVISGVPAEAGNFSFTVQVRDSRFIGGRRTATKKFNLTVNPPSAAPSITTSSLSNAQVLEPYFRNLEAQGGKPPLLWTAEILTLPPGLALSPGGSLTGVPASAGEFNINFRVTDALVRSDNRTVTLQVDDLQLPGGVTSFPIMPTNRIPTGLKRVGRTVGALPGEVGIDWGDESRIEPGLLDCASPIDLTQDRTAAEWAQVVADLPGAQFTCDIWGDHRYRIEDESSLPAEFIVTVSAQNYGNSSATATVGAIGDYLVVSIGDSVASGEGNPVVKRRALIVPDNAPDEVRNLAGRLGHLAYWNTPDWVRCGVDDMGKCENNAGAVVSFNERYWFAPFTGHRAADSGAAIAVRRLRERWPERTISLIHLAKSGANIKEIANNQVPEIASYLPAGDFVDALLITAGANNVAGGFGNVVTTCLLDSLDCSQDLGFRNELRTSLLDLAEPDATTERAARRCDDNDSCSYAYLSEELNSALPGRVDAVFLTEYFDPTGGPNGAFPAGGSNLRCTAGSALQAEWRFLHAEMVCGLNRVGVESSLNLGFDYVGAPVEDCAENENECNSVQELRCKNGAGGVADDFRRHGYCVDDLLNGDGDNEVRYVVGAEESIPEQGDTNGTAHPNRKGQAVYADHIVRAIIANEIRDGAIVSSILPTSRSVMVGNIATAFATIINTGEEAARHCSFAPVDAVGEFSFQVTDPLTNAPIGRLNEPVSIPGENGAQSFVFSIKPGTAVPPTELQVRFDCSNREPAQLLSGVNTFSFSASVTPVADVIALSATLSGDGFARLSPADQTAAFAVASVNVGAAETITVRVDLPVSLPGLAYSICPTNPISGACLQTPASEISTQLGALETQTFSVFLAAAETVQSDPAVNRVRVVFTDSAGQNRGSTSVAVVSD